MRSILIMAAKDLVLTTRDWLGLFFIVAFPILMGIFFGSMYGGIGQRGSSSISVGAVDDDNSEFSKKFLKALDDNDGVNLEKLSRDEAMNRVRRGDLVGTVAIPKGFGETAGYPWLEAPEIELSVDPSRQAEGAMLSGLVMQASGRLVMERIGPILSQGKSLLATVFGLGESSSNSSDEATSSSQTNAAASDPSSDKSSSPNFQIARIKTVDVTHKPEPGSHEELVSKMRSRWDISFPQGMLWGVLGCAAAFAISVVRERKQGTLLRLAAAPNSRAQIVLGKALACFTAVLLVIAMMTALGVWLGMRPRSPVLLAVASVSIAASFVGITILMSVMGRSEEGVAGAAWGANTIMAMFGGAMIPLAFMPPVLRPLSQFSPVKWSILALEGAIWRDFTPAEMLTPCGILLAFGAACLALGAWRLSRMAD